MYGFGKALDRLRDGALVRRESWHSGSALRIGVDGGFEHRVIKPDGPHWWHAGSLPANDLLAEDWMDAAPDQRGGQVITPDLGDDPDGDIEGYDGA